ncbi:MAG: ABC transporter permease [Gammaproteobacteria bacterium]|nr:ABC transporter permease [Gammaproteobacteria bacterium]
MHVRLSQFAAALAKETRILLRDKEAVLILIVMPAVFVLIMSLALRDTFRARAGNAFSMAVVDQDGGPVSRALIDALSRSGYLRLVTLRAPHARQAQRDQARLREAVLRGEYRFALFIPAGASRQVQRRVERQLSPPATAPPPRPAVTIRLLADPALPIETRDVVADAIRRILQGIETGLLLDQFARLSPYAGTAPGGRAQTPRAHALRLNLGWGDKNAPPVPTSVQQNAPSWTLLAMFFLVIPLSVTLIKERQQGCLLRLQTMPVPTWIVLGGKILPYFIINQIQVVVVLLEGMYLLPLLGGDALRIGHSPGGIVLVAMAANLAAIGYGLMVATFTKTHEQATSFGAVSVLILGAIGGVMVPKLVMPASMQRLANLSPLSWGLDGFQDIFVRGGHAVDVLPEVSKLLAFAGVCFAIAILRFNRELKRH